MNTRMKEENCKQEPEWALNKVNSIVTGREAKSKRLVKFMSGFSSDEIIDVTPAVGREGKVNSISAQNSLVSGVRLIHL